MLNRNLDKFMFAWKVSHGYWWFSHQLLHSDREMIISDTVLLSKQEGHKNVVTLNFISST